LSIVMFIPMISRLNRWRGRHSNEWRSKAQQVMGYTPKLTTAARAIYPHP